MRSNLMSLTFLLCVIVPVSVWGQKADNTSNAPGCTAIVFGTTHRTVGKVQCRLVAIGNASTEKAAIDDAKAKLAKDPDLSKILQNSEVSYRTACGQAHGAVAGVPAPADRDFNTVAEGCTALTYPRFAETKQQAETSAVQDCIDAAVHNAPRAVKFFQSNCQVLKSW
jgi:hypothetical protein